MISRRQARLGGHVRGCSPGNTVRISTITEGQLPEDISTRSVSRHYATLNDGRRPFDRGLDKPGMVFANHVPELGAGG